MSNNYVLRTERIGLREWLPEDIAQFALQNLDSEVMRYFPAVYSVRETVTSIKRYTRNFKETGIGPLAAEFMPNGQFIGFIGLSVPGYETEFTPCVEIGWRLNKHYWNMGLATEGARACLDYGLRDLDLEKIYSFTPLSNKPSERVMIKIGMKKIGTFMHPMVPDGNPLKEHLLYCIER